MRETIWRLTSRGPVVHARVDAVHLRGTEVCKNIADLVTDPSYEVDLEHPMRTILVTVAGGSVMLSVVEGYDKLHRFHIHSKTYTA